MRSHTPYSCYEKLTPLNLPPSPAQGRFNDHTPYNKDLWVSNFIDVSARPVESPPRPNTTNSTRARAALAIHSRPEYGPDEDREVLLQRGQ
jgi:hypothetical protein